MLQIGIQPEKRMRKDHMGETSLSRKWSVFFSRIAYIFLLYIDIEDKVTWGQQT